MYCFNSTKHVAELWEPSQAKIYGEFERGVASKIGVPAVSKDLNPAMITYVVDI